MNELKQNTKQNELGKKAFKAGIWYTVSSISMKCISIVTTPIFTRLLSKESYGVVSNFVSWYSLISIFCTVSLSYSVGRAKLDYPGRIDKYIGAMQTLSAFITVAIVSVMLAFIGPVSRFMELPPSLLVLLVVYLFFSPAVGFAQNGFRYSYKYKGNIIISLYTALATVVLSFIFIFALPDCKALGRSIGIALPTILLGGAFWINGLRKKNITINLEYWKYGLKLSLPLVIHTVSLNILAQSDRMLITKFCGSGYNGIYSLAYSYALLINLVIGAANEAWLPWFHDTYHFGQFDEIRKKVKPFIMLECMMGIGCIAIAPEAILLLGGAEYAEGVYAVAPIVIGVICQYVYTHYVNVQMTLKRTGYISVGTVFAAGLNIILNIIFIPIYGYVAAAYTTLAGYIALMLIHYSINRFVMKSDIYDNKFMFGSVCVVGLIVAGFVATYETFWLRYFILVVVCLVYVIFNKDFITSFIKRKKKI